MSSYVYCLGGGGGGGGQMSSYAIFHRGGGGMSYTPLKHLTIVLTFFPLFMNCFLDIKLRYMIS